LRISPLSALAASRSPRIWAAEVVMAWCEDGRPTGKVIIDILNHVSFRMSPARQFFVLWPARMAC
jgi:hypothetical protein